MEKNIIEIHPGKGINEIKFGDTQDIVCSNFGEPGEIENFEDDIYDEQKITLWYYPELNLNFYFENDETTFLSSIEVSDTGALLFGKKVFLMAEKELIALMKKNGYSEFEKEEESWGEHRLSFDDALIDFYFENEKLQSINWSYDAD